MVKHRQLHVLIILITVLLLSALVIPNTRAEDSMLWYHGGAVIVERYRFDNTIVYISYPNNEVLYSYRNAYLVTFDLDKLSYDPLPSYSPPHDLNDLINLSVLLLRSDNEVAKKVNISVQNLRRLGIEVRGFIANTTTVVSGVLFYRPPIIPIIYVDLVNHAKGLHMSAPDPNKVRLIVETIKNVFQGSGRAVMVCDSILRNISRYYTFEFLNNVSENARKSNLPIYWIYKLDHNTPGLGHKYIMFVVGGLYILVPCGIPAVARFELINTTWDELPADAKVWVIEKFKEYIDFTRRYVSEDMPLYVYVINNDSLPILVSGDTSEAIKTITASHSTTSPGFSLHKNALETPYTLQVSIVAIAMVGALILALHTYVRRLKS